MNERIRQLAEQAGFMDSWFSESGDDCERELKKFAELIVEECLYIVEGEDDGSADTKSVRLVMLRMKKHFGVEE